MALRWNPEDVRPRRILLPALVLALLASVSSGAPPVSYQGYLEKDADPFTGTAAFKLAIVRSGETIWSNDGTSVGGSEPASSVEVEVEQGAFHLLLGLDMEPLPATLADTIAGAALRVWVDTGDGFERLEDQPLGAGLYSMGSAAAESAPGDFTVAGELEVNGGLAVAGGASAAELTLVAGGITFPDGTALGTAPETGVVSLNGLDGPLQLVGAGGAVVTAEGRTITITATGGGGGEAGVQAIQNADGSLVVSDPVGPIVTLGLAEDGVTSVHLAAGSVGTAEIRDRSINDVDIAPEAGIAESKLDLAYPTHDSANDPNAGEKAALAGTAGRPSAANRYVTSEDTRLRDRRAPAGPAGGHLAGAYPDPVLREGVAVTSLNGLTDDVALAAGDNVSLTVSDNQILIAAEGAGGNTLDEAYDEGGAGQGRILVADSGPVHVRGADGVRVDGSVAVAQEAPLGKLHVGDSVHGLSSALLHDEQVVIESEDAALGIYSSGFANHQAALYLGKIAEGNLVSKWSISNDRGASEALQFRQGREADYLSNTLAMQLERGRLGIGTAPGANLHVKTAVADVQLLLEADPNNDGSRENDNPFITLSQDGGLTRGFLGLEGTAGSRATDTRNNALVLGTETASAVQLMAEGSVRLTVHENGRVGVGTTNPAVDLHVAGATRLAGNTRIEGDLDLTGGAVLTDLEVTGSLSVTGDVELPPVTKILALAGEHCAFINQNTIRRQYVGSLPIEDGALLRKITVVYYDNDPANDLRFFLIRTEDAHAGSGDTIFNVDTTGASDQNRSQTTTLNHTVSSKDAHYRLAVTCAPNVVQTSSLYLQVFRVEYEIPGP